MLRISTWPTHLEFGRRSPVAGLWICELSRDHRLVRFDMRGTGLSDREVEDVRPARWVADLEAVVDAAGLARFVNSRRRTLAPRHDGCACRLAGARTQ